MLLGFGLVFGAGLALSWSHWEGLPRWSPDGLYYEAQRLELEGTPAQRARDLIFFQAPRYRRARVQAFSGLRKRGPSWVNYSARFYRRRWFNSAAAAVLSHWFGIRSLMLVSLAGFIAIGLALYIVLLPRFSWALSAIVAGCAMTLAPVRLHSFIALTDSWGLALLTLCLAVAYRVVTASAWWLVAFAPLMTLLAFTRDNWVVLIAAGVILALYGHRRGWWLSAAGLAAVLPAVIPFPVPVRDELAFTLNRYQPTTGGWEFIARKYPWTLVHSELVNGLYVLRHPFTGAFFILGLIVVLFALHSSDPYFHLMVAAIVGGVVLCLANPNWDATEFRFELVLLPAAAAGISMAASRISQRTSLVGAREEERDAHSTQEQSLRR